MSEDRLRLIDTDGASAPPYISSEAMVQIPAAGYTPGYPVNDLTNFKSNPPPPYTANPASHEMDYQRGQQNDSLVQQQTTVVLQRTLILPVTQSDQLVDPPKDYLCYSIFVTVCCCWLIGIFAIINSSNCRAAKAAGNRGVAEATSRQARNYATSALVIGMVFITVFIFLNVLSL